MDEQMIFAGLRAFAKEKGGIDDLEVSGVRKLQGGNSSEIWAFDGRWPLSDGRETRPLVLRSGMANEFAFVGRDTEFEVLKALSKSSLPVPNVYWFDAEGQFFGRPAMVTERCPGVSDRNLMTGRNGLHLSLDDRAALGRQMMTLLARLHGADEAVAASASLGEWLGAEQQLAQHDEAIARLEIEPCPELRYASWWLWRHLPKRPSRPSIIHGDYRPANILVEGKMISAVLDWEFAHLGDPAEDLGWFLSPYYEREHLIANIFEAEDALTAYELESGILADRDAVRFWGIFAMYKLAYMTVAALRWMVDGDATRMASSSEFVIRPLLAAIAATGGARAQ